MKGAQGGLGTFNRGKTLLLVERVMTKKGDQEGKGCFKLVTVQGLHLCEFKVVLMTCLRLNIATLSLSQRL